MKLQDIKKPTLQEALGLAWVFDLHETLNARFDDEAWHQQGAKLIGDAFIDGEHFRLLLEPGTFPIDGFTYHFINVAFQKIVDGKPTEKLQLTGRSASRIVGAIANALLERVQLYDFDAVVFFAADSVDERMRVYDKVAERKWTRLGFGEALYDIDAGSGKKMTVLYSKDLAKQKLDTFIDRLKTLKKK